MYCKTHKIETRKCVQCELDSKNDHIKELRLALDYIIRHDALSEGSSTVASNALAYDTTPKWKTYTLGPIHGFININRYKKTGYEAVFKDQVFNILYNLERETWDLFCFKDNYSPICCTFDLDAPQKSSLNSWMKICYDLDHPKFDPEKCLETT